MAQQARAVRTRRAILEAAAAVFDECGYEGASTTEILTRSGLTRGALYFHFPSKEAIADAVIDAQAEALVPPPHKVKLQATIDLTMAFAERLRTDVVLRAAIRLSVEQASYRTPTAAAYRGPADVIVNLLTTARREGELLTTVDPEEVTQLIVGAFAGIQLLSQVYEERRDLPCRIAVLWKYLLPSLAVPGLLPHLRANPERGAVALATVTAAAVTGPGADTADPGAGDPVGVDGAATDADDAVPGADDAARDADDAVPGADDGDAGTDDADVDPPESAAGLAPSVEGA
ncbi:ScbR family autoregulator-binding transcription factor [Streptantibioticus silvisoli]|uniref:ScbR family autoregulator-binding transcription factor n=1 Tax=Streptantibioticus silvisoli TaxID=2705255 RepID=A0ABT6W668_9ACTN|nr:ScbR family autoregulator-binding transcription factor [Streptantibioticus silvisoli]MDI5966174.1 ScbR family autoregulator-binding transcription factor [Streptantibioticus silvisoli]